MWAVIGGALLVLFACSSESSILSDVESAAPGSSGAGGGSSKAAPEGKAGAPGAGAASGEPPAASGNVISVEEGTFQTGAEPTATEMQALPAIVSLTGPPAVTNGGAALLHVTLDAPLPSPSFVVSVAGDSGYHLVTGSDPDGDGSYDIRVQVAGEATE